MMSRTHLAVGMAASLALFPGAGVAAAATALAGGALGSVAPDIDIVKRDWQRDALIGQIISVAVAGICTGLLYLLGQKPVTDWKAAGIALGLYVLFLFLGYFMDHRGFTHSIVAMLLGSVLISIINFDFGVAYLIGFASHLAIDLLNKKGLQLFYPFRKRYCLHLCYASKAANQYLKYIGFAAALILLVLKISGVELIKI